MVEPLGAWRPERLAELARGSDLIAIGGGELIRESNEAYSAEYGAEEAEQLRPNDFFIGGLGPTLEESCPVAWHSVGIPSELGENTAARLRSALDKRAYVSVRDDISRERLLRAGVTSEITVVPDSAFLVGRVTDDQQLKRRLDYLRGIDSYPSAESPLVVQGGEALLPHVEEIGRALTRSTAEVGDVPIVLLETGQCHGDGDFAAALAPYVSGGVFRMPGSLIIEDIVAAIAYSRGFVGISLHANVIAFARGIPSAVLDLGTDFQELAGFAALARCEDALVRSPAELYPAIRRVLSGAPPWDGLNEIARQIDSHFDALAEIAEHSASSGLEPSPSARHSSGIGALDVPREREISLQAAFEARGHRLVEQRLRLGSTIENLERQHENEIARLGQMLGASESRIAELDVEIEKLRNALNDLLTSKSIRYTAPFRAFFGRIRRLVT